MFELIVRGLYSDVLVDREAETCCKRTAKHKPLPHIADRELAILKDLKKSPHANIIELLRHDCDAEGNLNLYFLFYEHSVLNYIRGAGDDIMQALVVDIAAGIAHLHRLGFMHRDICPSNIVVDIRGNRPRAIVIDFGISWSSEQSFGEQKGKLVHAVGTGSFRAPELLFGDTDYDHSIDLWALGCTIFQLAHPQKQTLFDANAGDSDLRLILSIFRTLGTPTSESWRDSIRLKSFSRFEFNQFPAQAWKILLPIENLVLVKVVEKLVCYNSGDRLEAAKVGELLGCP